MNIYRRFIRVDSNNAGSIYHLQICTPYHQQQIVNMNQNTGLPEKNMRNTIVDTKNSKNVELLLQSEG